MTAPAKHSAKKCAGAVGYGSWGRTRSCSRSATISEGGKDWCTTHAPSRVAERKIKTNAAREERWQATRQGWAREEAKRVRRQRIVDAHAELVAALRQLLGFVVGDAHLESVISGATHPQHDDACSVCRARAAIAKAEGGAK